MIGAGILVSCLFAHLLSGIKKKACNTDGISRGASWLISNDFSETKREHFLSPVGQNRTQIEEHAFRFFRSSLSSWRGG
jgi:hypothetical protein